MMKPGDFVSFDPSVLEKKPGRSPMLLAWKDQKLILDHTTIRQLATIITDQYGTSVRLEGDSTPYKTVTAVLPNNNLDILTKSLEATSDFDIVRDSLNNAIVIKAHGQ
jgi:ferric-dicitrate binding protein FerR (iron transport regulator)